MTLGVPVEELNAMKVAMAELRTEMRHLSHDVKNLTLKLDAVPSVREVEALEKRLNKVEGHLTKAAWAIIGAWISGIGVVFSIFTKAGQ
jgi:hypothetical protein